MLRAHCLPVMHSPSPLTSHPPLSLGLSVPPSAMLWARLRRSHHGGGSRGGMPSPATSLGRRSAGRPLSAPLRRSAPPTRSIHIPFLPSSTSPLLSHHTMSVDLASAARPNGNGGCFLKHTQRSGASRLSTMHAFSVAGRCSTRCPSQWAVLQPHICICTAPARGSTLR